MSIQLIKEVVSSAITELGQPVGKVAYSFNFDVATGGLSIVRNAGGSSVKLSDTSIINTGDPITTVWSDKLINFSWSSTYPGHLDCEIV